MQDARDKNTLYVSAASTPRGSGAPHTLGGETSVIGWIRGEIGPAYPTQPSTGSQHLSMSARTDF
jgi:hypothetical protein